MSLNTILYNTNPTPNPYNLGKYAIYVAPSYEQNYYWVNNNQIQTQYTPITLSILDSVPSGTGTITFLFSSNTGKTKRPFIFPDIEKPDR